MNLILAAAFLLQEKTAEQLIEKLRSEKSEERSEASQELRKRGESVLPVLEKATTDKDAEVSRLAKETFED